MQTVKCPLNKCDWEDQAENDMEAYNKGLKHLTEKHGQEEDGRVGEETP